MNYFSAHARGARFRCLIEAEGAFMQVQWRDVLPVWWSFFWRAAVFGALLGFLLGALVGVLLGMAGSAEKAPLYGALAGWVGAIPASMLAMKQALTRHLPALGGVAARMSN